jgi:hypothetical protein
VEAFRERFTTFLHPLSSIPFRDDQLGASSGVVLVVAADPDPFIVGPRVDRVELLMIDVCPEFVHYWGPFKSSVMETIVITNKATIARLASPLIQCEMGSHFHVHLWCAFFMSGISISRTNEYFPNSDIRFSRFIGDTLMMFFQFNLVR